MASNTVLGIVDAVCAQVVTRSTCEGCLRLVVAPLAGFEALSGARHLVGKVGMALDTAELVRV